MALVYVQRYKAPAAILSGGTQYVDGMLKFNGATSFVFDANVFSQTGTYVLFDYTNGSFPGGQAELDAYVSGSMSNGSLNLSGVQSFTDEPANNRILVTLGSNPTNGKQFVDGNLDFAGATTMQLSAALFATSGTYELFEVTGAISNLSNLTCVSLAGFLCSAPFQVGNLVKVTLS